MRRGRLDYYRGIKKFIVIRKKPSSMNRDEGSYHMFHLYDDLLPPTTGLYKEVVITLPDENIVFHCSAHMTLVTASEEAGLISQCKLKEIKSIVCDNNNGIHPYL